jgi:16S rRNA (guanine1207-N2)-methyltransferase
MARLPKAKDEQEMTAHACLDVLNSGGRFVLYGGNDEGIRSAAGMIETLCGAIQTVAARGHGRVIAAQPPPDRSHLRNSLREWRIVMRLRIGGAMRDWISYPGLFAANRIDEGTELLLTALPELATGARVLDFGCGSGVIGAHLAARTPDIQLDMMDNDTVALEAVRENVPQARRLLAENVTRAHGAHYDAIVSNPPLHSGIAEDHAALQELISGAPTALHSGGVLSMVVQRRVPLDRLLSSHFETVEVAAETGRYRVWQAGRPRGSR